MGGRTATLKAIAGVAFAAALSAAPQAPDDADDAREAALRYMFVHNASMQQRKAAVHCLTIEGKDPTDTFVARFAELAPPVKKASECTASAEDGVHDKTTGARGLIFRVAATRVRGEAAEIDGGYYEAGLSASWNTYYLEKKDGRWMVVKDVMHWIS